MCLGQSLRWIHQADSLEAVLTAKHDGALASPVTAGYGAEGDVMRMLEQARTHLAGDHFTVADLFMTAYLSFYMQFGMLERLPAFEAFCAHHLHRPAGLTAKVRDEPLIAARKAG